MGRPPELAAVVVVGAGPVGLTLALELARAGVETVVLDRKPGLEAEGSRAIVLARHALETFDRLGCAAPMVAKGAVLERARTYYRDRELFTVEFPRPAPGEPPAFLNLQQTYTERWLFERVAATSGIDVRWAHEVAVLEQDETGVTVVTRGEERLRATFAVACDGVRSAVRALVGVPFSGRNFADRFLIADVRAQLPFPNERRFFFDPPVNPGRQVLIHPQPDDEWRIDWQVPAETDAQEELRSGRLDTRVRDVIGDVPYELAWLSSYRFQERCADRFRAGRVLLAGDAAHVFAPFGARGLNSGVEDARNLGWKLGLVVDGAARDSLLDTYNAERRPAALENVAVTTRTMRFMAPPNAARRLVRNAILRGSVRSAALRRRVDSGKLAVPAVYPGEPPVGTLVPSGVEVEPLEHGFGLAELDGTRFVVRPDGYVLARADSPAAAIRTALHR